MASNSKVEMSLDDIIRKDRKAAPKKGGPKKGGIVKKIGGNARKGKLVKKAVGIKKRISVGGQQNVGNTAATKRLVQKLVKKALARKNNEGGRKNTNQQQTRVVRQVIRNVQNPSRGVSRRSQVITKAPRSETIIVRRIVKPRPQPRQQIIREVFVQEPRQRIISQPVRRFKNSNRPQVVYVQERNDFGGQNRSFGGQQRFGGQQQRFGGQQQRRQTFGGQQQQRQTFGGQKRQTFGGQKRSGGGNFQRTQRRQNTDPFYEPVSFLQR